VSISGSEEPGQKVTERKGGEKRDVPPLRRFFVRVANKRFTRVVPVRVANDRVKVACFVDVSGCLVRVANKGLTEEGIDLDWCGGTLEDHVAPGHFRVARSTVPSKIPL
jgi:hypothetical protein